MSKVGGNSNSAPKRPKTGGRTAGTPNKTTAALKDAILAAAEAVGHDGNGKEGLTGYLKFLAAGEPKAFAGLLGKVLPMQVFGPGTNGEHGLSVSVSFVGTNSAS